MRPHNIFLFAYVALPVIAAPVSTSNISPFSSVERRSTLSLIHNLLARVPIIEGIPTNKKDPRTVEGATSGEDLVERGRGVHWTGGRRDAQPTEELVGRGRGVHWTGGKRDAQSTEELVERGRGVHWTGGKRDAQSTEELLERGRGVYWSKRAVA